MSGVLFGAYLQTLSSGKLVPNIAILLGIAFSCIFSYVKGVFGFGMVVLSLLTGQAPDSRQLCIRNG